MHLYVSTVKQLLKYVTDQYLSETQRDAALQSLGTGPVHKVGTWTYRVTDLRGKEKKLATLERAVG